MYSPPTPLRFTAPAPPSVADPPSAKFTFSEPMFRTPVLFNVPPLKVTVVAVVVAVNRFKVPLLTVSALGVRTEFAAAVTVVPLTVMAPAPFITPLSVPVPPRFSVVPAAKAKGADVVKVLLPPPLKLNKPAVRFTPPASVALLLNAVAMLPPLPSTFSVPVLLNALTPAPPRSVTPMLFIVQVPLLLMLAPLDSRNSTELVPFTVCDTVPCVFSVVLLTSINACRLVPGATASAPVTV